MLQCLQGLLQSMPNDSPSREALFAQMIACGDRLIEAQNFEASLSKLYARRQAAIEEWQEARRWVEGLAAEYAEAVGRWREAMEREASQATMARDGKRKFGSPLIPSRNTG
jgi:hypothetical protein